MSQMIFDIYMKTKSLLLDIDHDQENLKDHDIRAIHELYTNTLMAMEKKYPWIHELYESTRRMQESFTMEQADWICSQIGHWYLEWKDKMWIDGKPNQHWLGIGKEHLKMMICGG